MASQPRKDAICAAVAAYLREIRKGAGYRTELGRNVSRRRWNEATVNQTNLPCASVWMGNGEPAPVQCMGSYKERAYLVVEVWTRTGKEEDLDTACLEVEADVRQAVMAHPTLGLTGVTIEPSKNVADHQEFGDLKMGSKVVGFLVDYTWTATAP